MSARGAITVQGTVLETVRRNGEFEGRAYDFQLTSVLVGTKVIDVRFNPDNGDARVPADGAVITLEVELPKGTRPTAKRYVEAAASEGVRKIG